MAKAYIYLFVISISACNAVAAQATYQVGFSSESIDPPEELFSIALAGYGAPREGRFSLKWSPITYENRLLKGIAGNDDKLFGLTADQIIYTQLSESTIIQWKILTGNKKFTQIAANNKKLFAINETGEICSTSIKCPGNWQKVSNNPEGIIDLAVNESYIFIVLRTGGIYKKSLNGKSDWVPLNKKEKISGITLGMGRLIALTEDNDLYRTNDSQGDTWVKISRLNHSGNNTQVKKLAVAAGRLYGSNDSALFISQHNSQNNLTASSLIIQSKKQKVLIIELDICGVDNSFTEKLKSNLYEKFKIAKNSILINSSHTHFSPVGQDYSTWNAFLHKPDTNYLKVVEKAVLAATRQAVKNQKPSFIEFGRGKAPIGRNRSLPLGLATYDDDVDIIKMTDLQKRDSILLFSVGCHPVETINPGDFYVLSANYPGLTRQHLKERYGYSKTMFIQGCGGDINPIDKDPEVTARKLSRIVDSLAHSSLKKIQGPMHSQFDSVIVGAVSIVPTSSLQSFKEGNSNSQDVFVEKNERWANLMLKKIADNTLKTTMPVYIQVLGIGDWKLIGISREVVTDYSLGIKRLFPEKQITVAGYSNGVESYLPTYKHIQTGTYEGVDSFLWYGQPGRFPESIYTIIIEKIQSMSIANLSDIY